MRSTIVILIMLVIFTLAFGSDVLPELSSVDL